MQLKCNLQKFATKWVPTWINFDLLLSELCTRIKLVSTRKKKKPNSFVRVQIPTQLNLEIHYYYANYPNQQGRANNECGKLVKVILIFCLYHEIHHQKLLGCIVHLGIIHSKILFINKHVFAYIIYLSIHKHFRACTNCF